MHRVLRMVAAAGMAVGFASVAQAKIYSGSELEALRCSAVLGMTSTIAHQEGWISDRDRSDLIRYSVLIEMRYVSGTNEEKSAARNEIWNRRTLVGTLNEFSQIADYCSRQFPVF